MSSVNSPRAPDLAAKLTAAGIPTEIKPAAEIDRVELHPEEAIMASKQRLDEVTATPEETPVHHTRIDVESRQETVTPADRLDPEWSWFMLGFAYACIPGLDRSLIELYQSAGGFTIAIKTHRTNQPVAAVSAVRFDKHPWNWLIQGVPAEHAAPFRRFVESYCFRVPPPGTPSGVQLSEAVVTPGEHLWTLSWSDLRIRDPIRLEDAVDVSFALPFNETTQRGIKLLRPPGVFLFPPLFEMTSSKTEPA